MIIHAVINTQETEIITEIRHGEIKKWFCITYSSPTEIQASDGTKWNRDGMWISKSERKLQEENIRIRKALIEAQDALEEHGITITQNKIKTEREEELEKENTELRQEVIIGLSEKQTLRDQIESLKKQIEDLRNRDNFPNS